MNKPNFALVSDGAVIVGAFQSSQFLLPGYSFHVRLPLMTALIRVHVSFSTNLCTICHWRFLPLSQKPLTFVQQRFCSIFCDCSCQIPGSAASFLSSLRVGLKGTSCRLSSAVMSLSARLDVM